MNPTYAFVAILIMAGVTFLTRALPFLLFGRDDKPPRMILYLGSVLPPAIIAMLIVYCLRGVSFAAAADWAPALIASLAVVGLHVWKKNNMLSIMGGTILYMILVQAVFV